MKVLSLTACIEPFPAILMIFAEHEALDSKMKRRIMPVRDHKNKDVEFVADSVIDRHPHLKLVERRILLTVLRVINLISTGTTASTAIHDAEQEFRIYPKPLKKQVSFREGPHDERFFQSDSEEEEDVSKGDKVADQKQEDIDSSNDKERDIGEREIQEPRKSPIEEVKSLMLPPLTIRNDVIEAIVKPHSTNDENSTKDEDVLLMCDLNFELGESPIEKEECREEQEMKKKGQTSLMKSDDANKKSMPVGEGGESVKKRLSFSEGPQVQSFQSDSDEEHEVGGKVEENDEREDEKESSHSSDEEVVLGDLNFELVESLVEGDEQISDLDEIMEEEVAVVEDEAAVEDEVTKQASADKEDEVEEVEEDEIEFETVLSWNANDDDQDFVF